MGRKHTIYRAARAGHLKGILRRLINPPGRILRGYIHPGDTVLDLGCGPGYFTLPMARVAGGTGTVIAVDVQEEMLEQARHAAEREGLLPRIRFHRASGNSLNLEMGPVLSFALAFHVMHETEDIAAILTELHRVLRPAGLLLIAEPMGVVGAREFRDTIATAERAGFRKVSRPFILLSRAVLLEKGP
jgi:ubiquinone/menaquinone biosynthesis C-methylase UbiE